MVQYQQARRSAVGARDGQAQMFWNWFAAATDQRDIASLARNAKFNAVSTALNCALLLVALQDELTAFEAGTWAASFLALLIALNYARLLKRRPGNGQSVESKVQYLTYTSPFLGLPWAWMATQHIAAVKAPAEVAIFIVCAGMSAGAALALARIPTALFLYLVTVLGAVFIKCVTLGTVAYFSIAGFTVVYAASLIGMAAFLATTQRKLEASTELVSNLLDNVPQGVCLYGPDQRIVVQNDMFSHLYGLRPEDVPVGTHLQDVLSLRIERGIYAEDDAVSYRSERMRDLTVAYNKVHHLRDGRYMAVGHRPLPDGGWVTSHEDITPLKAAEARIAHLAHHDSLTGLANRNLFQDRFLNALAQVGRGQTVELLLLDLDHFKAVNDDFGHATGDELLKAVASRVTSCVRKGDTVARTGGDEFVVLLVNCDQNVSGEVVAQRIVDQLATPFEINGRTIQIGVSIGIAGALRLPADADALLKAADSSMYEAKRAGGNRYHLAAPRGSAGPLTAVA